MSPKQGGSTSTSQRRVGATHRVAEGRGRATERPKAIAARRVAAHEVQL